MMKSKFIKILVFSMSGYLLFFTILSLCKVEYYYYYSLIGAFIFGLISIFIRSKKVIIYDNIEIFRLPFKLKYWQLARKELSGVKQLVLISLMTVMLIIANMITMPSGFGALGISLNFIVFSLIGLMFGPFSAIVIGLISDTILFFLVPTGYPYFFGYTFSKMLTGFIYGIMFYRSRISYTKCFLAMSLVNIVINALIGSLWWAIINSYNQEQLLIHFLTIALPKNLIFLVPQSILMYLIIKGLSRILVHLKVMDERIKAAIDIF